MSAVWNEAGRDLCLLSEIQLLLVSVTETYYAHVPIHCCNTLVGVWFEEFRRYDLLDCQHHSVFTPDAYRCPAILDRFDRILDLKVSTVGREDRVGQIVSCTY